MEETRASRFRQGLKGDVEVEDGFGGERCNDCAGNFLAEGAY